jgi:hypothetical protein
MKIAVMGAHNAAAGSTQLASAERRAFDGESIHSLAGSSLK